jgi:hypothetical protein
VAVDVKNEMVMTPDHGAFFPNVATYVFLSRAAKTFVAGQT